MISAEPIELTEDNVKRLFASCMDRTKHPTNAVNLYSFRNSSRSPAIMYLENSKTEDLSKQIEYLFGQLKSVHDEKETFTIQDGFYNYHGDKWTNSSAALALLYYMGIASYSIRPFYCIKEPNLITDVSAFIKPTFFPPKQEESIHV